MILACIQHDGSASNIGRGASIYPAVQNPPQAGWRPVRLRRMGLASVLITRPRRGFEKAIKELLGIPENVDTPPCCPWATRPTALATAPPPVSLWRK